jgi:phosphate-selective porin
MTRTLNISFTCVLLLLIVLCESAVAQTTTGSTTRPVSESEAILRELAQQKAQLEELMQVVRRQAEMIERQQSQIESLQQAADKPDPAVNGTSAQAATPAQPVKVESPVGNSETSVRAGAGKIQLNGLIQGWFVAGDEGFRDTFRVRRAEFKMTGEITPRVKWTLMIDPSKALALRNTRVTVDGQSVVGDTSVDQGGRILQDAFITYETGHDVKVNVGQFKIPLSLEGLQSSATLDTIERALFMTDRARGGNYGDVRDLGVSVNGVLTSRIDYQLGLFNGSGESFNDVDRNDGKSVAVRIVGRPAFLPGLQVGGSGVWAGNGSHDDRPRRNRFGAEMLYVKGRLKLKSELMIGADGSLRRRGYYAHFGYRFRPRVEGIFRFDTWDPDTQRTTNSTDVAERDYVAGINYYVLENKVKLQFNYARKTFDTSIVRPRNLMMINLQTSW